MGKKTKMAKINIFSQIGTNVRDQDVSKREGE